METYRIGEIAQHAGVSVPAVRYYERLGLLVKALRVQNAPFRLDGDPRDFRRNRAAGARLPASDRRAHRRLDAMNRRKLLLVFLVVLAAIGGGTFAWLRFATHDTPAGQPPLALLDAGSLATLKADFNRAAGETRMIVLLSPT